MYSLLTRRFAATLAAEIALGTSGCHGDCAGVGRPAFGVTVRDARTGAVLTDSVHIYVIRQPELLTVDSTAQQISPGHYWAAEDLTGRFNVVVERAGYYPWTVENQVVSGTCTVQTIELTAELVRRVALSRRPSESLQVAVARRAPTTSMTPAPRLRS